MSLLGTDGAWDAAAEQDVEHLVYRVEGLRGAPPSAEAVEAGVEVLIGVLVLTLVAVGVIAAVLRQRRPAAAPSERPNVH